MRHKVENRMGKEEQKGAEDRDISASSDDFQRDTLHQDFSSFSETTAEEESKFTLKRFFLRAFFSRIRLFCKQHWKYIYAFPPLIFVFSVLIFGENNLYRQIKLSRRISHLERRIKEVDKRYRTDKAYLEKRQKENIYDIEALARKKYGLKKEGEMIFLLIDTTATDYKQEETPITQ